MFDNVAFQVVLGLVFIYLLYSLVVTILGEVISTKFGIRARLLRVGIERMLNDGYYERIEKKENRQIAGKKFQNEIESWLRKDLLYESDKFATSFAGRFYEYPAIKYLGRIEDGQKDRLSSTKPSYISADYFADSLISFLADKGAGATEMEKIAFCLKFNTYDIQPRTLRQFINLFERSDGKRDVYKLTLIRWYNETMDRATGWHKRKMRVISFWLGLLLAICFNIDTISIAKILANDKDARSQLVNMSIALSRDSSRYKDFIYSNGDSSLPGSIVDSGFSRLTKDIRAANLVLGLGWDFNDSLKSDYVSIRTNDRNSNNLVQKLDSLRIFISRNQQLAANLRASFGRLTINKGNLNNLKNDSIIAQQQMLLSESDSALASWKSRLAGDSSRIDRFTKETEIINAGIRKDSGALKTNDILIRLLFADIKESLGKDFIRIDSTSSVNQDAIRVYGKRQYNAGDKVKFILAHIFWYNLVGLLLTALALSLGAPFWFDLLKKLVSIRGVGVKPEEKKTSPVTEVIQTLDEAATSQIPVVPVHDAVSDVVEAALKSYTLQLKNIPGVKSVFSVIKNGEKRLQVNVDTSSTKGEVERQVPKIMVGQVEVPYLIVETGVPISHQGEKGLITNRSGKNSVGSVGCILERRETGSKHILSCWHVLKGDLDYSVPDNEPFIIDFDKGDGLAERWAGGILEQFDYGLARCTQEVSYTDNSFLKTNLQIPPGVKLDFRFVSNDDIKNQIAIKFYDFLNNSVARGIIYTEASEVDIDYIDRTRTIRDVLILTDENENTISKAGNSGSIVFDEQNRAIAMVIGGDSHYTYAVKLSHIFRIHREMIIA